MSEGTTKVYGVCCCQDGKWILHPTLWPVASEAATAMGGIQREATNLHCIKNPGSQLRIPVMPIEIDTEILEKWYADNHKEEIREIPQEAISVPETHSETGEREGGGISGD
jgi:hypothetical protein